MEEWRDVIGYEGLYQVSNKGNVKSLNYGRTGKEKIMKPRKGSNGYLYIKLFKDGKSKTCSVHRLVAEAFLENTNNLPEVNHISEDKEDNRVSNLEWCSHIDNCNHGTRNRRVAEKISIPIYGINKVSGLIVEFSSAHEAERITGIRNSHICECCQGKRKSAGGFYWMYAEEEN